MTSHDFQCVRELLDLLVLTDLVIIDENRSNRTIQLNYYENQLVKLFIEGYSIPLQFDIYQFDLNAERIGKHIEMGWVEYFAQIALQNA